MDRRGLRDAIARIESGKTGGIVVARLDRFARTMSGGMAAIERVVSLGGRVVSVAEHVDPATAAGRMLLGILLVIAQWQRETATESFEAAVRNAAARKLYAARPSYGYMKREEDGRIVRDPETAPTRLRIYQRARQRPPVASARKRADRRRHPHTHWRQALERGHAREPREQRGCPWRLHRAMGPAH